jgi:hypothetical protein
MTRHLLPNEIDLLVDGDAGFGVAPLRAHLAECTECRARVDELRAVVHAMDALPHFAPRARFADDVMAQVQVIEPWHVALAESARRLVPASAPLRLLAATGAGIAAITISGSALWLAFRADLATWVLNILLDRGRSTVLTGAGDLAAGAGSTLPASGFALLAIGATVLAASALAAVAGFRRLAATARANRS